jgi:hypothetical protein
MALTTNGIEFVRVYELPGGIRSNGGYVGASRRALVKWRSSLAKKFYQVYVNGYYAGGTYDIEQRQMVIQIPTSLGSAVRIEVFAVEIDEVDKDLGEQDIGLQAGNGRVRIAFLRSQGLPIDAEAEVYFDGGTGEIDYGTALNYRRLRIWPSQRDKAGFAMSRFGEGDFGYDSGGAVGFGRGSFGNGQFGLNVDVIEWVSPALSDGVYRFAIVITDSDENRSTSSQSGEITVISRARPAERLNVASFDKATNKLVLSVS